MKRIEPIGPNDKKSTGKVFDVMRPGRAPANATSKPVIVGSQVQDPSVSINGVGDRRILGAPDTHRKIVVSSGTRSKPIEVPNEPDIGAAAAITTSVQQPVGAEVTREQEVEALAEVAIDGVNKGEKAWEAPVPQASTGPLPSLAPDTLLDGTAAPDLDGKGIVVSKHANEHGGSVLKTTLLVVLSLVLAVAIFDLLLDAEVMKVDAVPHTNFL